MAADWGKCLWSGGERGSVLQSSKLSQFSADKLICFQMSVTKIVFSCAAGRLLVDTESREMSTG